jgi:hypothetical protein
MRSLAEASRKGIPAARAARPVLQELAAGTQKAPELANNSAIVFEHLNNRDNAVEEDPRSPGGKGYTGFEAILQWLFDQSQAINIYDKNGHILKVNLFHSKCSAYQNPKTLREQMAKDPTLYQECAAILGPNQPGITTPDPTSTGNQFHSAAEAPHAKKQRSEPKPERRQQEAPRKPDTGGGGKVDDVKRDAEKKLRDAVPKLDPDVAKELGKRLQDQLGIDLPNVPGVPAPQPPALPQAPSAPSVPSVPAPQGGAGGATDQLLDYLFAP